MIAVNYNVRLLVMNLGTLELLLHKIAHTRNGGVYLAG